MKAAYEEEGVMCNSGAFNGLPSPEGKKKIAQWMQEKLIGKMTVHWRLRDWLRLLSFEVEGCEFGCYRPALRSDKWLQRFGWMDRAGAQWWPILGSAYLLVAVKRVRGMRLMGPAWKAKPVRASRPVSVANSVSEYGNLENKD